MFGHVQTSPVSGQTYWLLGKKNTKLLYRKPQTDRLTDVLTDRQARDLTKPFPVLQLAPTEGFMRLMSFPGDGF